MAKLNDVRALAKETAEKVSRSPQEWTKYLDTTARLYRYPFSDSLLIHAQRPDAEACASMELWNGKMCRWIKRGAKGIALIDDRGRRKKLRYVFDISDTRLVRGGRTPFLWQIREEQREAVRSYLAESYWLEGEGTENLPAILQEIAFGLAKEELGEAMEGLEEVIRGKEQKTGEEFRTTFKELLANSLFYVLVRRCGLEPMEYLEAGAFAGITEFGELSRLSFLGDATNKLAEPVLIGIRKEMQKLHQEEAKKKVKQKEKGTAEQAGNDKEKYYPARVKEVNREKQKPIEKGEEENEVDLSPERRLPVSGFDHQRGEDKNREVRNDAGNISERTSERVISEQAKEARLYCHSLFNYELSESPVDPSS